MVMKTYAVVDEEADGAAWNRNSRVMMKGLENKDEQYLLEINCHPEDPQMIRRSFIDFSG